MAAPLNQEQVLSSVRGFLAAVGGFALGRGWIDGDTLGLVTGSVVTLWPIIWGIASSTKDAMMSKVEAMPEIKAIVIEPHANGGVGAAADDPSRGKVIREGQKTAADSPNQQKV